MHILNAYLSFKIKWNEIDLDNWRHIYSACRLNIQHGVPTPHVTPSLQCWKKFEPLASCSFIKKRLWRWSFTLKLIKFKLLLLLLFYIATSKLIQYNKIKLMFGAQRMQFLPDIF